MTQKHHDPVVTAAECDGELAKRIMRDKAWTAHVILAAIVASDMLEGKRSTGSVDEVTAATETLSLALTDLASLVRIFNHPNLGRVELLRLVGKE